MPNSELNRDRSESAALKSILGNQEGCVSRFFEVVWQSSCAVFGASEAVQTEAADPYQDLIKHGWKVMVDLMEQARRESEKASTEEQPSEFSDPLLFQNQTLVAPPDRDSLYGSSLFSAFLDGCSVVVNHADLQSPWIAALCLDLQKSFPHAYANTYLTPPSSQAVAAHADDRDVLVIQIVGSKAWKVYQRIPIPLPYPHEQVGKNSIPVPSEVLDGPVLIERILQPGDVLYMPRGYVHEAQACNDDLSFHATVALATHDWSLAGLLQSTSQRLWRGDIANRSAIARDIGMQDWNDIDQSVKNTLQQQIDTAIHAIKQEMSAETVHRSLHEKYKWHNEQAWKKRKIVLERGRMPPSQVESVELVGRKASERVTLSSKIRKATDHEKASIPPSGKPRGLLVRQENVDAIMGVLQQLRDKPGHIYAVRDFTSLLPPPTEQATTRFICDLTILCFAKQCVELGALAVLVES